MGYRIFRDIAVLFVEPNSLALFSSREGGNCATAGVRSEKANFGKRSFFAGEPFSILFVNEALFAENCLMVLTIA
jgi:hypothetical protein